MSRTAIAHESAGSAEGQVAHAGRTLQAVDDLVANAPMGLNAFGAENMTCWEAELFAAVLRAAGHGDVAAAFTADHAEADLEGDQHYSP